LEATKHDPCLGYGYMALILTRKEKRKGREED
jgi:hypothetical protein